MDVEKKLLQDFNAISISGDETSNYNNKLNAYSALASASSRNQPDPVILERQQKLPIFQRKDELIKTIRDNQVVIVVGDTGSGKTTQIPQYLKEMGYGSKGRIGCTQLRRMAAKSVAKRVAEEQGCELGETVGYTIRFEDLTSPHTQIQYMTDGILIRECIFDKLLSSYSAIILDESHERSIDTDILLGMLRYIVQRRTDLKVIVSSATIDSDKFSKYFFYATVFNVSGRMFPVQIEYKYKPVDYILESFNLAVHINENKPPGDILIFMSGEDDITALEDHLWGYVAPTGSSTLIIRPCYSGLSWEEQALIFEPSKKNERKVIIATNIAETSITVEGVLYVIDSGYVKQKVYNATKKVEELQRIWVSQAQAIQRQGRAGRVAPGICYRLYTEYDYLKFDSGPKPEIKRSILTNAIMVLKQMGFTNLKEFEFLDPPPSANIENAVAELKIYGALDCYGQITDVGKNMAAFPLEPDLAKMLIVSVEQGCSEEILTIVAALSVPNIMIKNKKKLNEANSAHQKFYSSDGDLCVLLNVYNEWIKNDKQAEWCSRNFINYRQLLDAEQIRDQLRCEMTSKNMLVKSSLGSYDPIRKSICAGFIQTAAKRRVDPRYAYETISKKQITYVHPGSALFKTAPGYLVYQKVTQYQGGKAYMRCCTPVESTWLHEFGAIVSDTNRYDILQSHYDFELFDFEYNDINYI